MSDTSDSDNAPKKKRYLSSSSVKVFQESWLDNALLKPFLVKVDLDNTKAMCKLCNKIMNAGKSELIKHANGKKHMEKIRGLKYQKSIAFTKVVDPHEENVKTAELKLTCFIAEHNVAVHTVDHLTPLLKSIFPDSKIAAGIDLKRSKCTALIKNVLAKTETCNLVSDLKKTKFSIMVDESTDITDHKNFCILVRYINENNGYVVTKLLELLKLHASEGSAENLYSAFKSCLQSHGIPVQNIIGMASDGCNLMTGRKNSFYSRLRNDVPNLILISCICHSAAIVAARACEELPRSPEELLRLIYNYVSGSAKRCTILQEIQAYFKIEQNKILKLSATRWLSRHTCVVRLLDNYEVLKHYFQLSAAEDKLLAAENILSLLNNTCNKAYLHFLKYVLNVFNRFNALFQSRAPQIHNLYMKSNTLFKELCQNFIKLDIVLSTNFTNLNIKNPTYFLQLNEIYVGSECETLLNNMPENTAKEVRLKCLNFYITAATEIQTRLPLNNDIFKEMASFDASIIFTLKSRSVNFEHLSIVANIARSLCEAEYRKLIVSFDFEKINEFKQLPIEEMWFEIEKIKSCDDTFTFKHISALAKFILTLPHSNAEAERIFSIANDVKNRKRNRIGSDALNAICVFRSALQNESKTCVDYKINKNHLSLFNVNVYNKK